MTVSTQFWTDGSHPIKWLFIDQGFSSARAVISKGSKVPVIKDFYVEEDLRGYRVGTKFLKEIEKHLSKVKNIDRICVQTGKNDSFYLKRGYEVLDENYLIKRL